jgi:hypothetical protein
MRQPIRLLDPAVQGLVALTSTKCRCHLHWRTGIDNVDLPPIDAVVVNGVAQHGERLRAVIGKKRLSFEVFPLETLAASEKEEAVALIDQSEMKRKASLAFIHLCPVGGWRGLHHVRLPIANQTSSSFAGREDTVGEFQTVLFQKPGCHGADEGTVKSGVTAGGNAKGHAMRFYVVAAGRRNAFRFLS